MVCVPLLVVEIVEEEECWRSICGVDCAPVAGFGRWKVTCESGWAGRLWAAPKGESRALAEGRFLDSEGWLSRSSEGLEVKGTKLVGWLRNRYDSQESRFDVPKIGMSVDVIDVAGEVLNVL